MRGRHTVFPFMAGGGSIMEKPGVNNQWLYTRSSATTRTTVCSTGGENEHVCTLYNVLARRMTMARRSEHTLTSECARTHTRRSRVHLGAWEKKRRAAATVHSSNVPARRMSMARRSKHNRTSECVTMLTKCSQARRIATATHSGQCFNPSMARRRPMNSHPS